MNSAATTLLLGSGLGFSLSFGRYRYFAGLLFLGDHGCCILLSFPHRLLEEFFARATEKRLHHIASLRRGLKELVNFIFLGPLECLIIAHLSLVCQFGLVTDEVDADLLTRVILDFIDPIA